MPVEREGSTELRRGLPEHAEQGQGGKTSFLWGGLRRTGVRPAGGRCRSAQRCRAGPMWPGLSVPDIGKLDFDVKLWDFRYRQFLFFSRHEGPTKPACTV